MSSGEKVDGSLFDRIGPLAIFGGVLLLLAAAGRSLLNDPDIYWHTTVGRWILDHGFPTTDPFSFTHAGDPWIAKEWLSQIVLAGAEDVGSWVAVVLVGAVAGALAVGLVARALRAHLRPVPALLLSLSTFVLIAGHLLARPHALALPILAAWTAGLVRAVDERRPPAWWLVALMLLWANVHSSFLIGLALAGALALDSAAQAEGPDRVRTLKPWLLFGVAATVVTWVTPYGPGSFLAAVKVLSVGDSLAIIGEWQPADFSELPPIELALLAGVALALWRGFTLPPVRVVLLLGLLHLALSAVRNADLVAVVVPLLLAAPLARQFPGLAADGHGPARAAAWRVAAVGAAVVVLAGVLVGSAEVEPSRRFSPVAAVEAMVEADAGPVLNAYDFGGYLVYVEVPTFIDGRTELFEPAFMLGTDAALRLERLDILEELLDDYEIGAVLLPPGAPAVAYLDRLPDWERAYADEVAVLHVRR